MFIGQFTHTIDSKGRLSIPVKFREDINSKSKGTVFITTELDPCLVIYTIKEWKTLLERINNFPVMNQGVKAYRRLLFSRATECSLDKQGRILIPQNLREHAGLSGDTYLVGNDNKIEIWYPGKWDASESSAMESMNNIREELAKLGM
ncbi:MAG: division/cell wall cluster transcriptional repressor MraZ [Nitrospirota bacterium]|uniref:Transcriptional regulator MraZ n=1 Tax=hydrothermal vent metagenome TaxID=652676 RepID=A0A3B1CU68_9ZZZZ|nr:division/cell wall cluster transcriptional repressor MraZ [Nitrospirota bacterium]NOY83368.1 division/cell wall cluster transcriptional repressor MraZ [Candidatus Manganitrophaceae bacterium]